MNRREFNAVSSSGRALSVALFALILGLTAGPGCIFLGSTLPPANRPVRGPGSFHHPDRYDSTYNAYKSYEGYNMEGIRQFEAGFWSLLGGWRLGLVYGSVSMPIMATPVPRGTMVMERAATCILWVCFEDDQLERKNKRNKIAAVSTVDGRVTTVLFGIYSRRTIVYTGWSQEDWEKSGGGMSAPATMAPPAGPAPASEPGAPATTQEKPPVAPTAKPPAAPGANPPASNDPKPAAEAGTPAPPPKEEIRVK